MPELDPFDDFEFKPLTDGLGFHKKAEKIKADVKSTKLDESPLTSNSIPAAPPRFTETPRASTPPSTSTLGSAPTARPASQSISDLIASLPPSLDFVETPTPMAPLSAPVGQSANATAGGSNLSRPQIFQPLARTETKTPEFKSPLNLSSTGSSSGAGPTLGSVLPPPTAAPGSSVYREKMNESFAKAFPHAEQRTRTPEGATVGGMSRSSNRTAGSAAPMTDAEKAAQKALEKNAAPHNMPGAILDAMVTLGISTIFLVCILAITRVNLMGLLTNANTDTSTQVHLAMLFVAVLQMYMLTARSFFGASLGEWAFDLQVGTDDQQRSAVYPLQVAWRTLLMTFTGFLVLPLLSLLFKRDLAQPLTGLGLIRRP
jgi:hypothetical protein